MDFLSVGLRCVVYDSHRWLYWLSSWHSEPIDHLTMEFTYSPWWLALFVVLPMIAKGKEIGNRLWGAI